MFLFFSVARFAHIGQAERANNQANNDTEYGADSIPALLEVSPEALCVSNPFNASYWMGIS